MKYFFVLYSTNKKKKDYFHSYDDIELESKCHFLLFFRLFIFLISIFFYFYWKKILKKRKNGTRDFFTIRLFLSYDLSCFVEPYLSSIKIRPTKEKSFF